MKPCARCGSVPRAPGCSYCRPCYNAYRVARNALLRAQRPPKPKAPRRQQKTAAERKGGYPNLTMAEFYDRLDGASWASLCLHHRLAADPCRQVARWRAGAWQSCDDHRQPGDEPIASGERAAAARCRSQP